MEAQKNKSKQRWSSKKILLSAIGGVILLYLAVMTYLYFYPALGFTIQLPTNPPAVLEPKLQSVQTHVDLIPGNGLGQFEFFVIPSNRTNFYANVDGGSLLEEKATNSMSCSASTSTSCDAFITPGGQHYTLMSIKDASDKWIYFDRGQTRISIELTERPRALNKAVLNTYIDSFQPVHRSFPVDHFTPGP